MQINYQTYNFATNQIAKKRQEIAYNWHFYYFCMFLTELRELINQIIYV